jgi:molybdopterin synthase catalytic subunit
MTERSITIQQDDFDVGAEARLLRASGSNTGAICTFTGLVREFQQDSGDQQVTELYLEHYPGMTEKALGEIVDEAFSRWRLLRCRVIHRVGALNPGDQIVFVGTVSEHRGDAFESAQFIMDYLKTRAPFWKRQSGSAGSQWVEHRSSDDEAARRWQR